LFDHLHHNFDYYFTTSKVDNQIVTIDRSWSARKSAFKKSNNVTLVEKVIKKLVESAEPEFSLAEKGIYLSKFTLDNKEFNLLLYSEVSDIAIEKVKVDDICDLVNNEIVNVYIEDEYYVISFFNAGKLQFAFQINTSDQEEIKKWLKYLGVLIESPTLTAKISEYWNAFLTNLESTPRGDTLLVQIVTNLVDENELNTLSSFSIDDGVLTGFFIERGKGTNIEEKQQGSGKRIPANTYEFVNNDCVKYYDNWGRDRRSNCQNEFRLITTAAKSGTRDGILVHTGTDYQDIVGCFIPVSASYSEEEVTVDLAGDLKTLTIYRSNGTSTTTLNAIKNYIVTKENESKEKKRPIKMLIQINR
jgi:hypothetical protein